MEKPERKRGRIKRVLVPTWWGAGVAKRDGFENHIGLPIREFESRPHRQLLVSFANRQPPDFSCSSFFQCLNCFFYG